MGKILAQASEEEKHLVRLTSVVGSVILAIGRPAFEDALKTEPSRRSGLAYTSFALNPWSVSIALCGKA